jgi:hypothetical protein
VGSVRRVKPCGLDRGRFGDVPVANEGPIFDAVFSIRIGGFVDCELMEVAISRTRSDESSKKKTSM